MLIETEVCVGDSGNKCPMVDRCRTPCVYQTFSLTVAKYLYILFIYIYMYIHIHYTYSKTSKIAENLQHFRYFDIKH